jgi:hypothetical protein
MMTISFRPVMNLPVIRQARFGHEGHDHHHDDVAHKAVDASAKSPASSRRKKAEPLEESSGILKALGSIKKWFVDFVTGLLKDLKLLFSFEPEHNHPHDHAGHDHSHDHEGHNHAHGSAGKKQPLPRRPEGHEGEDPPGQRQEEPPGPKCHVPGADGNVHVHGPGCGHHGLNLIPEPPGEGDGHVHGPGCEHHDHGSDQPPHHPH